MRTRALVLSLSVVVACGGGQHSFAPLEAGAVDAPLGSEDAGTSVDSNAWTGDSDPGPRNDAAIDVPTVDSACSTRRVADVPSSQTVRFHFAVGTGYLITSGFNCSAVALTWLGDGGPEPVLLGLSYRTPVCEGPRPLAPAPQSARDLAQAGDAPLIWDARLVKSVQTMCVDCSALGGPATPARIVTTMVAPLVRAQPGHYRASFAVLDTVPPTCTLSAGQISCGSEMGEVTSIPMELSLCPGTRRISADFDLPEGGDVDVTVAAN